MKSIFFIFILLQSSLSIAQKSLTLPEAEQQLQKGNLLLIAELYNVSASRAAVIQARIWEQPYVTAEFNAINPQNNKVFDVGRNGQKEFAIQQLIYLGGKKRNEIVFANSNLAIAELQFEQLLRNLKFQLEQTFYSVYFDKQKVALIEVQIGILDTLLSHYSVQSVKGNIPLSEVVRLQSLVLSIKNERNMLQKDIVEAQQVLSLLTGISEPITPVADETELIQVFQSKSVSKDSILQLAIQNNLDYLTAIKIFENQELFLKWQKSLSVPDLTAGASYDQRGGAFQNQVNLTLGIPLPFWNRNKGNIQIAEAQVKQTSLNKDLKRLELETKVEMLWTMRLQQQNQFKGFDKSTLTNLDSVYNGMVANFQKRNISMLEFTDFMESYNQTSIQINEIKKAFILSCVSLNNITNKEIF
jgi:cobalt-zinc-cadmium efflux system outer membrane protein